MGVRTMARLTMAPRMQDLPLVSEVSMLVQVTSVVTVAATVVAMATRRRSTIPGLAAEEGKAVARPVIRIKCQSCCSHNLDHALLCPRVPILLM